MPVMHNHSWRLSMTIQWTRPMTRFAVTGLLLAVVGACSGRDGQIVLSGTLETDDHDLIAPATAQLFAIRVREGDAVAVGDTVAVLDTIAAAAAYRAARATANEAQARVKDLEAGSDVEKIRAARAEVEIAQYNRDQAERDLVRSDSLFAAKLIDSRSLEQARLSRDNARAAVTVAEERLADLRRGARVHELEAAEAARDRAVSQLDAARRSHDQLILIAQHDGVIQWLPYQVGEYVRAGRAVVTIHDADKLWARVYLPEEYLNRVSPGMTVSFRVDAHPGTSFGATVVHVAATAEFTPRDVQTPDERLNLVYAIKLTVDPGQEELRAGMPADFVFDSDQP